MPRVQRAREGDRPAIMRASSVHLRYDAPPATYVTTAMTVTESAPRSFFVAIGGSRFYFGLQEHYGKAGGADKNVLCSVWDDGLHRASVGNLGGGVTANVFSGEGTGIQCRMPFDWQVGVKYGFCVILTDNQIRVSMTSRGVGFIASVFVPRLYTLHGMYSFIEDLEDGDARRRSARFGPTCGYGNDGAVSITRAQFTADTNPLAVNARVDGLGRGFILETGGDVRQEVPVGSWLELAAGGR
jgi:hypothetical protein